METMVVNIRKIALEAIEKQAILIKQELDILLPYAINRVLIFDDSLKLRLICDEYTIQELKSIEDIVEKYISPISKTISVSKDYDLEYTFVILGEPIIRGRE